MALQEFVTDELVTLTRDALTFFSNQVKKELVAQGHKLTGNLIKSIEVRIEARPDKITGLILFAPYGQYLERGVPASSIPFSGSRRGTGGVSKYIQALIGYFEKRGLSSGEAKRAAFATAIVHSREGMPTRASRRFSKTGERTGFLNSRIEKDTQKVYQLMIARADKLFEIRIENTLKSFDFKRTA